MTILLLGFVQVNHAQAWKLVWDASTGTVDGYTVEISTDAGATWGYWYVLLGNATREINLDNKCAYGQSYQFRVRAFNQAGVSAPTAPLTWTRPQYEPPTDNPLPLVETGPVPDSAANLIIQ